jgi:uncharacterized membrane protein YdjX (TVP38/TMEM64 family)
MNPTPPTDPVAPGGTDDDNTSKPSALSRFPWKWVLLAALAFGLWMAAREFNLQAQIGQALDRVSQLGPWGVLLFILVYIVATVLFLPGSALTLGAGALFGVVRGSIYVSIGSTLGATAAFLVGRHLARKAVASRIEGNPRFTAIDRAVANEGWKIVLLTRLSPVFPFALLNYAFGITRVKFTHYLLASWIGMMPGTVLYVYLGSLAQVATSTRTRSPAEWTLYAVGLLATLAATVLITRIARRALARQIA